MDDEDAPVGWFAGLDPDDTEAAATAIRDGEAAGSREWPSAAVAAGFADSERDYYDRLHDATTEAARAAVREREQADDQQVIHAVRALDDCRRVGNELAERVDEWAGSLDAGDIEELADEEPTGPMSVRLHSLAARVLDLREETQSLQAVVESTAQSVAPNLSALAGPELAARLIALAGGLDALAKKPAGTVQVLGAEDALFAHLRGGAPSPKHGVIYTHEYVRGTDPDERGSAARALAGKLAIAARVDHYSGDYRPELEAELDDRIERIRARGDS